MSVQAAQATTPAPAAPAPASVSAENLKEYRFLAYVTSDGHAVEGDPKSVLAAIDSYAWKHEWAMNLGDVKAKVVDSIVKTQLRTPAGRPVLALELGAYMGYSAIHFSSLLPRNSLYLSLEINAMYAAIATKMLEFAHTNADHGAAVQTKVVIGTLSQRGEYVRKLIRQFRESQLNSVLSPCEKSALGDSLDFIFIDHWKSEYVSDFLLLEKLGFIGSGTVVIADNIIYPGAPEYLELLTTGANAKLYDSKLHHSKLEYSDKADAVLVSVRK